MKNKIYVWSGSDATKPKFVRGLEPNKPVLVTKILANRLIRDINYRRFSLVIDLFSKQVEFVGSSFSKATYLQLKTRGTKSTAFIPWIAPPTPTVAIRQDVVLGAIMWVSWTAFTDAQKADGLGMNIYRATSSGGALTTVVTRYQGSLPYIDDVAPLTTYYYQVAYQNLEGKVSELSAVNQKTSAADP